MSAKLKGGCLWASEGRVLLGIHDRFKIEEDLFSKPRRFFPILFIRECWGDLAGIVREVWGSTRGTPMPCRWFLGFAERQAPRRYRMVVLG